MSMDSLKDLYIDELKDLYNAENQLLKALPKMAKKASAPELKSAFQDHLEQTKGHVDRLEKIFKGLGEKPTGKTCKAMNQSWTQLLLVRPSGSNIMKSRATAS
jgi:ferritin-like metal-binding protein YciE